MTVKKKFSNGHQLYSHTVNMNTILTFEVDIGKSAYHNYFNSDFKENFKRTQQYRYGPQLFWLHLNIFAPKIMRKL